VITKPEAPATSFRVSGEMFGPVKVEPSSLFFLVIPKGRVAMKSFAIRNAHAGHPLKITNLRLLDPMDNRAANGGPAVLQTSVVKDHYSFNIKETDPGRVTVIDVIVKDTMPAMSINTVLSFDTGVPGASPNGSSEMRIPITGVVR
jgi:hypothetical protein